MLNRSSVYCFSQADVLDCTHGSHRQWSSWYREMTDGDDDVVAIKCRNSKELSILVVETQMMDEAMLFEQLKCPPLLSRREYTDYLRH